MITGRIGTQNADISIAAINRSTAQKSKELFGKEQKEDTIRVSISPMGKKQSLIEQLMKQKQELTERMNSLSTDENKSGISMMDQIKEYQKQLEALDEQIAQLQTEQTEDKEKEGSEGFGIYEKPKTKTEVEMKQLQNIVELSDSVDKAETVSAVKDRVDGRINVLEAEIESQCGNIDAKLEDISDLEKKSSNIASQIAENIKEIGGQMRDIQHISSEKEPSNEDESSIPKHE